LAEKFTADGPCELLLQSWGAKYNDPMADYSDPMVEWMKEQGVSELTIARFRRAARARGLDGEAFGMMLIDNYLALSKEERDRLHDSMERRRAQAAQRGPGRDPS
jgi:hypothetical protein